MTMPNTSALTRHLPEEPPEAANDAPRAVATQVNVSDALELQLWALRFDATTGHVRRAVMAVGTAVAAVTAWIDGHRADDAELLAVRRMARA